MLSPVTSTIACSSPPLENAEWSSRMGLSRLSIRARVSSTGSGPTHVDLAWSYGDSDPTPRFDIYVNGQLWYGQVAGTAKTIVFLSPTTTYTFRVRARDSAGNWSDLSDPFAVAPPRPR